MSQEPRGLWQVHLRIPETGPVAIAVMRGDEHVTDGVMRPSTPSDALRILEQMLEPFRRGEQLFVTARTNSPRLSMWRTGSKATALYWCASAFAKLWRTPHEPPLLAASNEDARENAFVGLANLGRPTPST